MAKFCELLEKPAALNFNFTSKECTDSEILLVNAKSNGIF
jgi:hypothetical protein